MYLVPNIAHPAKECFSTYENYKIPDITRWYSLNGDFSWTGLELNLGTTQLETFKNNKNLWNFVKSPTACWINTDFDVENGKVLFYRDQQDCILWYYDLVTGKVYEYDTVICDTLEEFWMLMYIEGIIWYGQLYPSHLKRLIKKYVKFFKRARWVRENEK